jgi:glucan biosynthesis protein C
MGRLKGTRGVQGPVWYCATLLVFDGMYAVLRPSEFANPERTTMKERSHHTMERKSQEGISTMEVLVALASTSVASFLIRIYYPIGTAFWPLGVNIGYIPQYTLFYTYGIQSAHSNEELQISLSRRMLSGLALTSTMIDVLGFVFVGKELGKAGVDLKTMLQLAMGSPTPVAFLYVAWNEFIGVPLLTLTEGKSGSYK